MEEFRHTKQKYKLKRPSEEQQKIIEALSNDFNVQVNAVAGSGKTTSVLHIAKEFQNKKILLLTYNAHLKLETREKCQDLNLENLQCHSYHSFCVKHMEDSSFCKDDKIINFINQAKDQMSQIRNQGVNHFRQTFKFDIIIIDETQDMSQIYFQLAHMIITENQKQSKIQLAILGDVNQCINKDSDPRFLEYAFKLFKSDKCLKQFKKLDLSKSFRVTHQMAQFVNKQMIKQDRIKADKNGAKVRYIASNAFEPIHVYRELKDFYMDQLGYLAEDIFILAPTVKMKITGKSNPITLLSNYLAKRGFNIFIPDSNDQKVKQQYMENKIVFTTFNQSKGLERKVVIVLAFDNSYFDYIAKNHDRQICPNTYYVACTRALERLTVFQGIKNSPFQFLEQKNIFQQPHLEFPQKREAIQVFQQQIFRKQKEEFDRNTSPTDLVEHLSVVVVQKLLQYLEITNERIEEDNEFIALTNETEFVTKDGKKLTEPVACINGIAVVQYHQYKSQNRSTVQEELNLIYQEKNNHKFQNDYCNEEDLKDLFKKLSLKEAENENLQTQFNNMNISKDLQYAKQFLQLATFWYMHSSHFEHKADQMGQKYDWISKQQFEQCSKRLQKVLSNQSSYEVKVSNQISRKSKDGQRYNVKINGYIDAIDPKSRTVWEFKCTQELNSQHQLQMAIYMFMHLSEIIGQDNYEVQQEEFTYKLVNILSGELIELKSTYAQLCNMMEELMIEKYDEKELVNDDQFVENNQYLAKQIQQKQ